MSFLISSRFRRWMLFAVAVPLGSWLLARVAQRMREQQGGETTTTKVLSAPQRWRERRAAKAA